MIVRTIDSKPLGRRETQVPEIGIGTWGFRGGPDLLRRGLELGAVLVDTAESYDSEETVGAAVAGVRERVLVATKVSPANLSPEAIRKSVAGSLRRLRTDYIDLYQIHQPNRLIPIVETMGAMERLVEEGKIRFIGVSNFNLGQLQEASRAMRKYPIVSNQLRYNLADRTIEDGLLQYCQGQGITVIAYSPLARDVSRLQDCDPQGILPRIAAECGRSVAQVAINWCICKEGVIAIPKANSLEHMEENCAAGGWRLSADQLRRLDEAILSRRRGRLDTWLRKLVPKELVPMAKRCLKLLPKGWRRRLN